MATLHSTSSWIFQLISSFLSSFSFFFWFRRLFGPRNRLGFRGNKKKRKERKTKQIGPGSGSQREASVVSVGRSSSALLGFLFCFYWVWRVWCGVEWDAAWWTASTTSSLLTQRPSPRHQKSFSVDLLGWRPQSVSETLPTIETAPKLLPSFFYRVLAKQSTTPPHPFFRVKGDVNNHIDDDLSNRFYFSCSVLN